jgi:trehalose 6-phosphate phosphatase
MEHLLAAWPELIKRLDEAKGILLLSDYDGTLTPIVDRPEMAKLADETQQLLRRLSTNPRFKVGVVSGRAVADLKRTVSIKGIVYAGNHGFEIDGPGLSFINPLAIEIKPILRKMRQFLAAAASTIRGVMVEDKGLTLSVHYRQVEDRQVSKLKDIVEKTVCGTAVRGLLKITSGKKVFEVRPAVPWDKGRAIRFLMKRYGKGGRQSGLVPIFIGDDLTDEDGFRIISRYQGGISVHVGGNNPFSAASYYVHSPYDVYEFLRRLVKYSSRRLAK